ncbi:MAG: DUF1109 family protein [Alphaproteobacteria bacterium]|nr:DUF1109 family protein [Alphaproteobacteria bacterium]
MTQDNNPKNVDDLIGSLCDDLSPVGKVWCPYKHFTLWLSVSAIYFAVIFFFIGLRLDLMDQMHDPVFVFELVIGLALSLTGALCASFLSIPDMRGMSWFKAVPSTILGTFIVWNVVKACIHGMDMPHFEWVACINNGLFLEAFPLLFIIILSLRGKTTQPYWMTFMNVIAVAGVSWIGLRITCMMDDMGHAFMYHFLPVSVIGGLLILFGRRIFKW